MCRARHAASSRSLIVLISSSPTTTLPDVVWSIPATRFSSVVFPDPEGPMIATKACAEIARNIVQGAHLKFVTPVGAGHMIQLYCNARALSVEFLRCRQPDSAVAAGGMDILVR